jgi:hypothetical protein
MFTFAFAMGDAHRWYIDTPSGLKLSKNVTLSNWTSPVGAQYISAGYRPASPEQVSNIQGFKPIAIKKPAKRFNAHQ